MDKTLQYFPIIDVDGIAYAIASVMDKSYKMKYESNKEQIFCSEVFQQKGNEAVDSIFAKLDETSIKLTQNKFNNIFEITQAKGFIGLIKGTGNFRYKLDKNYKAKRSDPPIALKRISNLITDRYNLVQVNGIEVDDACGIVQTYYNHYDKWKDTNKVPIIVSPDKDLLQIEGHHLRLKIYPEGEPEYSYTSINDSIRKTIFQCLKGDNTDNIKGIEGCGEVCANNTINQAKHDFDIPIEAIKAYMNRYGIRTGTEKFARNLLLVYMLENNEYYDFEIPKFTKLL